MSEIETPFFSSFVVAVSAAWAPVPLAIVDVLRGLARMEWIQASSHSRADGVMSDGGLEVNGQSRRPDRTGVGRLTRARASSLTCAKLMLPPCAFFFVDFLYFQVAFFSEEFSSGKRIRIC